MSFSLELAPAGPAYVAWTQQVKAAGGVATTWPFDDQFHGAAAARYAPALYAQLWNAGQIDTHAVQRANPANTWIYVAAGKPVQDQAPQVANTYQTLAAAGFSTWDDGVNGFLNGVGSVAHFVGEGLAPIVRYLAIGAGVVLAAALLFKRAFR